MAAVADRNEDIKALVEKMEGDSDAITAVVDQLSEGKRRDRQIAAAALHQIAKNDPGEVAEHAAAFIDALNRPEAQTRWECLETLALLVPLDARACGKALPEAEAALFDEESGPVRLAAMRFLCKYGSTTTGRADKVWPLIDEGIQCYHGDLEFNDMLVAISDFSAGKLSGKVKEALAERMSFDASNGKGTLQKKAQQIIDNLG